MTAIVLDYSLSESWNRRASELDLQSADEATLRYRCFLGDIVFKVGDAAFSADWGWVPVLDFALSLRAIAASLLDEPSETQRFEFTESDAELVFEPDGPLVKIEANYVSARAEVSHVDLSLATERFLARVVQDLERRHPSLAKNGFVASLS
jgi:hypothetical protein